MKNDGTHNFIKPNCSTISPTHLANLLILKILVQTRRGQPASLIIPMLIVRAIHESSCPRIVFFKSPFHESPTQYRKQEMNLQKTDRESLPIPGPKFGELFRANYLKIRYVDNTIILFF
jgi:hypothetical protein